jgi:hypothetical protein
MDYYKKIADNKHITDGDFLFRNDILEQNMFDKDLSLVILLLI